MICLVGSIRIQRSHPIHHPLMSARKLTCNCNFRWKMIDRSSVLFWVASTLSTSEWKNKFHFPISWVINFPDFFHFARCIFILPEDLHTINTTTVPYELDVDIIKDCSNFKKEVLEVLDLIDKNGDAYPVMMDKVSFMEKEIFLMNSLRNNNYERVESFSFRCLCWFFRNWYLDILSN